MVAPESLSLSVLAVVLSKDNTIDLMDVPAKYQERVREVLKQLQEGLKPAKHLSVAVANKPGARLKLPKTYGVLVPSWFLGHKLSPDQRKILKLLRRYGAVPLQTIQDSCELTRAAVRRELGAMLKWKLVEPVRAGRGQAYRLA